MISSDRINQALKRFHFHSGINLDALQPSDKTFLKKHSKKISLKKKKVLFRQGSYPNGIYIIKSGKLKVYQLNFDGSIQILFIYNAGDVFGYRPIISNEYQPVTVSALEDCELIFISRPSFLELLNKSLPLSNQVLVSLCHEFTVLTNRMNVFAQRGIKERLALALLILNEKFKPLGDDSPIAEIIITRTDLANYVGTSLENLVRTIKFFKEKKLITTKGKSILISHFENLFILASVE